MLMIWFNRARNRSFDPVVLCFFGRIVPSDAPQNHGPQRKGIHKRNCNVLGLKLQIPAISNASTSEKQTPAQSLRGLFTDDNLAGREGVPPFVVPKPVAPALLACDGSEPLRTDRRRRAEFDMVIGRIPSLNMITETKWERLI